MSIFGQNVPATNARWFIHGSKIRIFAKNILKEKNK